MNFKEILHKFRAESFTEKEKGTKFERLMRSWLLTDPRYNGLEQVWLWEDFPGRKDFGGSDTGIDLVAKTDGGEYWAVQCKCYAEGMVIDKPAVDSFLATSSRTFTNEVTFKTTRFSQRVWISTSNHWGSNAEEAIRNQDPPVNRIGLAHFNSSPVDWQKLLDGVTGVSALVEGKKPRKHQLEAITRAHRHYIEEGNDRGKLIMACGTGKTYTSLLIAEQLLEGKGLVLFMVPSIALLGQSLNAWAADARKPIKAVCICSDAKASRKTGRDNDDMDESVVDLAVPATTNPYSVVAQLKRYREHDGLTVVFSTYQSIEAVSEAQRILLGQTKGEYGTFDLIICDEAHRTTGVKLSSGDESNFIKIHSNDNVKGRRRLYMTATPRLYGESAKIKGIGEGLRPVLDGRQGTVRGGVLPGEFLIRRAERVADGLQGAGAHRQRGGRAGQHQARHHQHDDGVEFRRHVPAHRRDQRPVEDDTGRRGQDVERRPPHDASRRGVLLGDWQRDQGGDLQICGIGAAEELREI